MRLAGAMLGEGMVLGIIVRWRTWWPAAARLKYRQNAAAAALGAAVGRGRPAPLTPGACLQLGLMVLWASLKSPVSVNTGRSAAGVGGRPDVDRPNLVAA